MLIVLYGNDIFYGNLFQNERVVDKCLRHSYIMHYQQCKNFGNFVMFVNDHRP